MLTYSWPSCSHSRKWEVPSQIHAEITPLPGPQENSKCIKSKITSFLFLFLHMQNISLVSLRVCTGSPCGPGSLLTTSVILCPVPQPTWPAFQRNKTVLLLQKLSSLQSTALPAICEQLSSQGRWKVSDAVQVMCCLLVMLKFLWETK